MVRWSNARTVDFDTSAKDSTLKQALARGSAVAESSPLPKPGANDLLDTRILKSETITLKMRAGGKEIEVKRSTRGRPDFSG